MDNSSQNHSDECIYKCCNCMDCIGSGLLCASCPISCDTFNTCGGLTRTSKNFPKAVHDLFTMYVKMKDNNISVNDAYRYILSIRDTDAVYRYLTCINLVKDIYRYSSTYASVGSLYIHRYSYNQKACITQIWTPIEDGFTTINHQITTQLFRAMQIYIKKFPHHEKFLLPLIIIAFLHGPDVYELFNVLSPELLNQLFIVSVNNSNGIIKNQRIIKLVRYICISVLDKPIKPDSKILREISNLLTRFDPQDVQDIIKLLEKTL